MASPGKVPLPWLKPAVFTGALIPLGVLLYRAATHALGADAIALALNQLGLLTLVFLVLALACTPVKWLLGWTWPLRIRRMLGLFAFFYGCLHFLTYAVLDQGLDFQVIVEDIAQRWFILVGFSALVLMTPLALTSTNGAVKKLGFKRWKALHRLAYAVTLLGVLHFWLRVKRDHTEPSLYAAVVLALLAARLGETWWTKRKKAARIAVPTP